MEWAAPYILKYLARDKVFMFGGFPLNMGIIKNGEIIPLRESTGNLETCPKHWGNTCVLNTLSKSVLCKAKPRVEIDAVIMKSVH